MMHLAQADSMPPKPERSPRREVAQTRGETLAREGLPATEVTLCSAKFQMALREGSNGNRCKF
jgi:hypothetical protein